VVEVDKSLSPEIEWRPSMARPDSVNGGRSGVLKD
jgi:hypothetical protein